MKRLDELERRVKALHSDALVSVTFFDGSTRRLALPDCIPIINNVIAIDGDGGEGNGQLLDLLRGLTN